MLTDAQREAITLLLRRRQSQDAETIPPRPAGLAELPLSVGQEQLWFIDRFAPGLPTYNIPQVLRLSGALDQPALERALGHLIARHEALRTRLVPGAQGRPVQLIDPPEPERAALEVEDLTGFEQGKRRARAREFIHAQAMRPFDLSAGPLLRACLVRLGETEHLLVTVVQHAVFDGWSARVFVRDLAALYRAEVTGAPSGLVELPVQFADYALWERDRLRGQLLADLEAYWRGALDGFETVQFPADRPRPAIDCFDGALAERMTDAALLDGLREVSRREGVTLFVTVLAGLLTLLHRYTGQSDLVVGTVSANRGREELVPLIGFLVNTLPIRCDLSGDPAFSDLLAQVKQATVGAYAHQDLPFGKLVDTLGIERDASRAPVFQIALTYAEPDDDHVSAADVEFAASDLVRGIDAAKFDLTFAAEARGDGLWFECCYKTALFDATTVTRLLAHLEVLLRGVVADPAARLSRLPLLTEAELRAELTDWNDTAAPVPPGCLHEAFEAQAARSPGAVAASCDGERISYRQLNRQANRIARRLRDLGVGPETFTGVCMRTGLTRLAVLLAIMKAGGGYVPLDPALPAPRLAFMIGDADLAVIVTDARSADSLPDSLLDKVASVLCLDDDSGQADGDPAEDPAGFGRLAEDSQSAAADSADGHLADDDNLTGTGVTAANAAYVLYTSGSTGQPKGVLVEHRNLVNFLHAMAAQWQIGPADAVLQFASFTFDVSVLDMFMPLLAGARVVLAAPETLHAPQRLAALMREAQITFACLPPAVLDLLPAGPYPDLRVLMPAGEELPAEVARRWIRPGLRLVNGYGPTETTVIATFAELDETTPMPPPIGFPTSPNYRAYVLDAQLNPVPAGVTGELHIGGASVARGYLNRPELTRERFIPDPFTPGQRLYKTGDLARRRPDGSIVYAGRIDNQVKIRGLRVELGEIEAALAAHPAVAQAIVTVTGPQDNQRLAAYLRLSPASTVSEHDVRAYLARTLPPWMVPEYVITVDEFPLNSSGKVDRSALPEPAPARQAAADVAPATLLELVLADSYATVLDVGQVGATDSFFDLGGNSLQVMRLIGVLDAELDVDVGVAAVFLASTPRQLAALLRDKHGLDDEDLGSAGWSSADVVGA